MSAAGLVRRIRSQVFNSTSADQFCEAIEDAQKTISELQNATDASSVHKHTFQTVVESGNKWLTCVKPRSAASRLLHLLGRASVLELIVNALSDAGAQVAEWLQNETALFITSDSLLELVVDQCRTRHSQLTPTQDNLIRCICRLPDVFAGRLGHDLQHCFLPVPYYHRMADIILLSLQQVCDGLRGGQDCSVLFIAVLLGKACLGGGKEPLCERLAPVLEEKTSSDPLWQRLCHTLITRLPQRSMEPVLDGLIMHCTQSLLADCPLYRLIGDLPLSNHHCKYILAHKYFLVRPPAQPQTIIGYLASSQKRIPLLIEALKSCLSVWSSSSSLRHMSDQQHLRISSLILLAITCIDTSFLLKLQSQAMHGIQVHIESPLPSQRLVGMVVGEHLMNRIQPNTKEPLKFDYEDDDQTHWLKSLMDPVEEQEKRLLQKHQERKQTTCQPSISPVVTAVQEKKSAYGVGLAQVKICSDSDSDDDLVAYDMSSDPKVSSVKTPRHLRTCLQGLLAHDKPDMVESSLLALEQLIYSVPSDLEHVCVELAKVLLHLADNTAMTDFSLHRHKALLALVVCCPVKVATYLCEQFYAPHYNIRQRMDILEVLSSGAIKLASVGDKSSSQVPLVEEISLKQSKPWQKIVEDRIKAKTRMLSKGPSKLSPIPSTSRFAAVCGHFFFPLMSQFDARIPTLDLLGRDSLLLGHLLFTLGSVMQAASSYPMAPVMAAALLDFCWAIKFHSDIFVRQGVLYCLYMLLVAVPPSSSSLTSEGLFEALKWVEGVSKEDPDQECRQLACLALAAAKQVANEVTTLQL